MVVQKTEWIKSLEEVQDRLSEEIVRLNKVISFGSIKKYTVDD